MDINTLLDGGLTLDDLDLHDFDDDLPALPLDRPRWRSREWWETSEAENHFLDLPSFGSAQDRAAYFVREMGRTALANMDGATADDPVFPHGGEMVSLNDLLATVRHDAVDEALSRL